MLKSFGSISMAFWILKCTIQPMQLVMTWYLLLSLSFHLSHLRVSPIGMWRVMQSPECPSAQCAGPALCFSPVYLSGLGKPYSTPSRMEVLAGPCPHRAAFASLALPSVSQSWPSAMKEQSRRIFLPGKKTHSGEQLLLSVDHHLASDTCKLLSGDPGGRSCHT